MKSKLSNFVIIALTGTMYMNTQKQKIEQPVLFDTVILYHNKYNTFKTFHIYVTFDNAD